MRYRRDRTPGATYFFTVVTNDRVPLSDDHRTVDLLRAAMKLVQARHPFTMDAAVVLPDHLHMLWSLPEGDDDYVTRWALIKAGFSRRLPAHLKPTATPARTRKREVGVWQRRYWEHRIRSDEVFAKHVEYIHWNPVKHGYAPAAADWPHSSFHSYVRRGIYPASWASSDTGVAASGPDE